MIKQAYNHLVRPLLPRKIAVWNTIPARQPRLLDATDHHPHYKQGLFDAIDDHVTDGDDVELVGFGRGVSTVHLLRAGARHVTAHDAAASMIELAEETLEMNDVPEDAVDVNHTLVGEAVKVSGDATAATPLPPSELTDADVLVLDCEGAEESILGGLGSWPETVIVETHPEWNVPAERSREAIPDGYAVESYRYQPDSDPSKKILVATE